MNERAKDTLLEKGFDGFCSVGSAHGLAYLSRKETPANRFLWVMSKDII